MAECIEATLLGGGGKGEKEGRGAGEREEGKEMILILPEAFLGQSEMSLPGKQSSTGTECVQLDNVGKSVLCMLH